MSFQPIAGTPATGSAGPLTRSANAKGKAKATSQLESESDDESSDAEQDAGEDEVGDGNEEETNTNRYITRLVKPKLTDAPSAATQLPWDSMTDISVKSLLVYYPNHAFTWPGLCLAVVQTLMRCSNKRSWMRTVTDIVNTGRGLTGTVNELKRADVRMYLLHSMRRYLGMEYTLKAIQHDKILVEYVNKTDGVTTIIDLMQKALHEPPLWSGNTNWLPAVSLADVGGSVVLHPEGPFADRVIQAMLGTHLPAPILGASDMHPMIAALSAQILALPKGTLKHDVYPTHIHPMDVLKLHWQDLIGEVLLYVHLSYEMPQIRDVVARADGSKQSALNAKHSQLRKRREMALKARATRRGTDWKVESVNYCLETAAYGRWAPPPPPHATAAECRQWAAINPDKYMVASYEGRIRAKAQEEKKAAEAEADKQRLAGSTAESQDDTTLAQPDVIDDEIEIKFVSRPGTAETRRNRTIENAAKSSAFWKAAAAPSGNYPEHFIAAELAAQEDAYRSTGSTIRPVIPPLGGANPAAAPSAVLSAVPSAGPSTAVPVASPKKRTRTRKAKAAVAETQQAVEPAVIPAQRVWDSNAQVWKYANEQGHYVLLTPLGEADNSTAAARPATLEPEALIDPQLLHGLGEVAESNIIHTSGPPATAASPFVPTTPVVRLVVTVDGRAVIVPTGATAQQVDPTADDNPVFQLITVDGQGVLVARDALEPRVEVVDDEVETEVVGFAITDEEAAALQGVPLMTAAELAALDAELFPGHVFADGILNLAFDIPHPAIPAAAINTGFENAAGENIVPSDDEMADEPAEGNANALGDAPSESSGDEVPSSSSSSSGSSSGNSESSGEKGFRRSEFYQSLLTGNPMDSELPDQIASDEEVEWETVTPQAVPAAAPAGPYDHLDFGEYEHATLLQGPTILPGELLPGPPIEIAPAGPPFPPAGARPEWMAEQLAIMRDATYRAPAPAVAESSTSGSTLKRKAQDDESTEQDGTKRQKLTSTVEPTASSSVAPEVLAHEAAELARAFELGPAETIEPILLLPAIPTVRRVIILRYRRPATVAAAPVLDESTLTAAEPESEATYLLGQLGADENEIM